MKKLQGMPLVSGIKSEELPLMLNCLGSRVKTFKKGEFVSLMNEPIRQIGVVIEGCIHMAKEDIWGNKVILALIGSQGIFGETFVCGEHNFATVAFYASEESVVLFLPFHKVLTSCKKACAFHHRLIENMVTLIADKNYQLMEKVEVTSKKTLREKILTYLSLQAQRVGKNSFSIPLTRTELSEYVCADRSALTRELYRMKKEGIIDFHKNQFQLFL